VIVDERISVAESDEIDLLTILPLAWRRKYLVLSVTLLFGVAAVVIALTATPIYRAEVVITEVHEQGMGGAGGALASQLGGLASVAGISLGANNSGRPSQAILKSRHLVEEFVKRNNLVPDLFPNVKPQPTLWLAVRQFQGNILKISDDQRQNKTTVSIEWTNPETAAHWANGFVALANEIIRARALAESTSNVAYLKDQIARTNVVELQKVMYDLIESETKTLMLANARAEYAFTVVDPAVAPEIRISPRRVIIVSVSIGAGLFISLILALVLDRIDRRRSIARRSPISRTPS
jgi:uncharacterized protein involved in exopolysaccharide biosynthesis